MAARDEAVECAAGEWTLLTDAAGAAGDVSVGLVAGGPVWLKSTATSASPAGVEGSLTLVRPGDGWSQATIAEMLPGVAGATFLHARPVGGLAAVVGISHA